jgi:hypothetical protein
MPLRRRAVAALASELRVLPSKLVAAGVFAGATPTASSASAPRPMPPLLTLDGRALETYGCFGVPYRAIGT